MPGEKEPKEAPAPTLPATIAAGETVRLLHGAGVEAGVEVDGKHISIGERAGAKRSASGVEPRWCPWDAAREGACKHGESCAYAHVAGAPEGLRETLTQLDSAQLMPELRIILVDPQDSRNVGSVARLCANFGIDDVWVVSQRQLAWEEKRNKRCKVEGDAHPMLSTAFFRYAEMLATPEGLPLLKGFHVVPELPEALAGIDKAIAFTGKRGGTFRTMTVDVPAIPSLLQGGVNRVALVFGNEATGLSSNDTLLCSHVCTLPTSAYCTSLNLSHSVGVVVSRLWELKHGTEPPSQGHTLPPHVPAADSEIAGLFEHCREKLAGKGYPCSKSDWGGAARRRNRFAYRCHKHVTSLLHLAQRAQASSDELDSIKKLLLLVQTNASDIKESDLEDGPAPEDDDMAGEEDASAAAAAAH